VVSGGADPAAEGWRLRWRDRPAEFLDPLEPGGEVFETTSTRHFTTFTGRMLGVPVSIIATGMGTAMMDFVVREARAIVDGDMAIAR